MRVKRIRWKVPLALLVQFGGGVFIKFTFLRSRLRSQNEGPWRCLPAMNFPGCTKLKTPSPMSMGRGPGRIDGASWFGEYSQIRKIGRG